MRSEHNHPVDENSYDAFFSTAVKVRKFSKKSAALKAVESVDSMSKKMLEIDTIEDMGDFALAMSRLKCKVFQESDDEVERVDNNQLQAVEAETENNNEQ